MKSPKQLSNLLNRTKSRAVSISVNSVLYKVRAILVTVLAFVCLLGIIKPPGKQLSYG